MRYIGEMRTLDTVVEKLTYLYLALLQPQTYLSLRRGLDLNRNTAHNSLKSLRDRGVLIRDDQLFWWIKNK